MALALNRHDLKSKIRSQLKKCDYEDKHLGINISDFYRSDQLIPLILLKKTPPYDLRNGGDLRFLRLLPESSICICGTDNVHNMPSPYEIHNDGGLYSATINRFGQIISKPACRLISVDSLCDSLLYGSDSPHPVIVVDHAMASTLANRSVPFVFDPVDSMGLYFFRRGKSLGLNQIKKKLNSFWWSWVYSKVERRIIRHARLTIIPSEADRQFLLKLCPTAKIAVVGNGTDFINDPPLLSKGNGQTIAFHGGMIWDPNRSAAIYLCKEIMPRLRKITQKVQLKIAGEPVFDELRAFDGKNGIEICGFVEDIKKWLAECDVYTMPMLQGGGVKNKLIEALACGLPVVTNSLGAEALSQQARDAICIANSADHLAEAIFRLLSNPDDRLKLRMKARAIAEREFSWQHYKERYLNAIAAAFPETGFQ